MIPYFVVVSWDWEDSKCPSEDDMPKWLCSNSSSFGPQTYHSSDSFVKFIGYIFWMIAKFPNMMLDMVDHILFNTNRLNLNTGRSRR